MLAASSKAATIEDDDEPEEEGALSESDNEGEPDAAHTISEVLSMLSCTTDIPCFRHMA